MVSEPVDDGDLDTGVGGKEVVGEDSVTVVVCEGAGAG